ncbi:MAG: laminin sub domain 2, partial [Actinomycetia bacterium]|nr:laminin sub domain 2 [Actinomycetes bacterium]
MTTAGPGKHRSSGDFAALQVLGVPGRLAGLVLAALTGVRWTRRRVAAVLLAVLCGVGVGAAAWAYWGAPISGGGDGAAVAASVSQGATPSASQTAPQTVTVSWGASSLDNGQAAGGYVVKRYDANTAAVQTILSNCTGTVAAVTCVEGSVPDGQWKYTVTPVIGAYWQGAESAKSGTVVVGASTLTLARTLFGVSLPQSTTGT